MHDERPTRLSRAPASPTLLAALLAALSMIGPFSIDTYLPSFPAIAQDLSATPTQMQWTLTAYMLPFAVMSLFHGTLSDSFGRRPVVLVSLVFYFLSSLGCALARDITELLLLRGLQGMSAGAGIIVARAIIRDSFAGHDAQRLMSTVTMIFGIAPALAPVVGGFLQSWFGWQAVFGFLAVYGAALYLCCQARLPETLPPAKRQPFSFGPILRNYAKLVRSPRLVLLCLVVALNFGGFFIYILSAPAFAYGLLKLESTQFAWLFLPGVTGIMFGAWLSGRLAGRRTSRQTVRIGYGIMFAAAAFNLAYSALAEPRLPWSVLPLMVYTTGMAMVMPSVTLLALDLFPHNRGMTSSLQGSVQSFSNGVLAAGLSPLVSHADHTLALAMAALLLAGWVCWMSYLHVASRGGREAVNEPY